MLVDFTQVQLVTGEAGNRFEVFDPTLKATVLRLETLVIDHEPLEGVEQPFDLLVRRGVTEF